MQFPRCQHLGFYPVVDRALWLNRLLPLGVKTIQLRIKDLQGSELEQEIQSAVLIAQSHNCQLFINDYWQLATKYQAFGVHLGQEDIDEADITSIYHAGLRLGISTHCEAEVRRALKFQPSYLAVGPIFFTTAKILDFKPQGIEGFKFWRQQIKDYPLVAIGGINIENSAPLFEAGADGIAVISDVLAHRDPEARTLAWLDKFKIPTS